LGNRFILDYVRKTADAPSINLENVYNFFKFRAYLQTTLHETKKSYCIKRWKTAERIIFMNPHDLCILSDSKIEINTEDSIDYMEWAMSQLEPAQAEVIKLSHFLNMTDFEISSVKCVSRQSVNAIKHRALKKLKEILKNNV